MQTLVLYSTWGCHLCEQAEQLLLQAGLSGGYKVVDIVDFDEHDLEIFSREVLKMISKGKTGWEAMLPKGIAARAFHLNF